jgi:hypothetical protein
MNELGAAVLRVDDGLLSRHAEVYGADPAARCLALALALTSGQAWSSVRDRSSLVVRPRTGRIGLFTTGQPGDRPLVEALGWHVERLLRRLRPIPFADAQAAALELAERLRAVVPADDLNRARLAGIPRGGWIVAGLLAYALGITRPGEDTPATTVIIVDDCSISGLRVREALERHRGKRVVVALLHAHPDLVERIRREPGVVACEAAASLLDHAPARSDYEDWKRRWAERQPHDYWIGEPDHVCYPWNEPDSQYWNEERGSAEPGWHVVPLHWCLKNRVDAHPDDVQVLAAADGPLAPSEEVVWSRMDDSIAVARTGAPGPFLHLDGSAPAMWLAMIATGERDAAVDLVAASSTASRARIATDFDDLVTALRRRGFIGSA